jgi:glucose-6-phosphate-specific signal transduction histidine kinase
MKVFWALRTLVGLVGCEKDIMALLETACWLVLGLNAAKIAAAIVMTDYTAGMILLSVCLFIWKYCRICTVLRYIERYRNESPADR